MTVELWKDIPDYPYQVSNLGNVRRVTCDGFRDLVPQIGSRGYAQVGLSNNGRTRTVRVHKLVATAFLGDTPVGYEVNHVDTNKLNNRADNLEYLTHLDNVQHAVQHNLYRARHGENHYSCKLPDSVVQEIRVRYIDSKLSQRALASMYGVNQSQISRILSNKTRKKVSND